MWRIFPYDTLYNLLYVQVLEQGQDGCRVWRTTVHPTGRDDLLATIAVSREQLFGHSSNATLPRDLWYDRDITDQRQYWLSTPDNPGGNILIIYFLSQRHGECTEAPRSSLMKF